MQTAVYRSSVLGLECVCDSAGAPSPNILALRFLTARDDQPIRRITMLDSRAGCTPAKTPGRQTVGRCNRQATALDPDRGATAFPSPASAGTSAPAAVDRRERPRVFG